MDRYLSFEYLCSSIFSSKVPWISVHCPLAGLDYATNATSMLINVLGKIHNTAIKVLSISARICLDCDDGSKHFVIFYALQQRQTFAPMYSPWYPCFIKFSMVIWHFSMVHAHISLCNVVFYSFVPHISGLVSMEKSSAATQVCCLHCD